MKKLEDSLLESWLNDNDLLGTEIDAISLIHSELWASSSQNESLDGDGCSEEIEWATIGEAEANKKITITFDYPTLKMIKHLKPIKEGAKPHWQPPRKSNPQLLQ